MIILLSSWRIKMSQFVERKSIKVNGKSKKVNVYTCDFCNKEIYFTPIIHKKIDGFEKMDLNGIEHICNGDY